MPRFAGLRPRSGLSPLPPTRNWRRSPAHLGSVYGPGANEIAHNLCTAIIDPKENSHAWNSERAATSGKMSTC